MSLIPVSTGLPFPGAGCRDNFPGGGTPLPTVQGAPSASTSVRVGGWGGDLNPKTGAGGQLAGGGTGSEVQGLERWGPGPSLGKGKGRKDILCPLPSPGGSLQLQGGLPRAGSPLSGSQAGLSQAGFRVCVCPGPEKRQRLDSSAELAVVFGTPRSTWFAGSLQTFQLPVTGDTDSRSALLCLR